MRTITLYGVKVAKWRTTGLGNKPCPPTLEDEEFVPVGVLSGTLYIDPKDLLDQYRKREVSSDWDTGDTQHSSMIQIENGRNGHGYRKHRWELRIYHHEYYTGWDVVTYHEEEYKVPEGKTWFVHSDVCSYPEGTHVIRYFSTLDKACEMYRARRGEIEDDPFDWHRDSVTRHYFSLGYIGVDGEHNEVVMQRTTGEEDEEE
jgi:hypothetical protein